MIGTFTPKACATGSAARYMRPVAIVTVTPAATASCTARIFPSDTVACVGSSVPSKSVTKSLIAIDYPPSVVLFLTYVLNYRI